MEFRDYLRILRRRWVWIVASTVLVGAVAVAVSYAQTPLYASSARLFVSTAGVDDTQVLQGGQFAEQRVKSYADLIDSRELAGRVIDDLSLDIEPVELSDQVSAQAGVETVNLTITVTDADPGEAQRIAQSYAEGLAGLVRDLEARSGEEEALVKATIVDDASFSDSPVSPNKLRNLALGLALGMLLGLGLAVLRELLDTRVRSTEELAPLVDAPTLGVIGFDPGEARAHLITQIPSHAPRAEAFRVLRTNLQFVDVDAPHKVVTVTSALPEEGKTATAVNLALSLAQAGVKTLLMDGDLRRPKATARLGMDGAIGVTSVLVGTVSAMDALQVHPDSGLCVMASGRIPPNPAELLQSRAMSDLVDTLRGVFDVIVIDSPPLLPVADGAVLAAQVDGAILVVRHGEATKEQVRHAAERLAHVDAEMVGTVVSMAPARGSRAGYGYGYGYGYGPDGLGAEPRGRRRLDDSTERRS